MSSDLLAPSVLDIATPFSNAALRSFDTDAELRARQQEKQQNALAHALDKKAELLASPDKIDSLVSGSLEDVFPLTAKPKSVGYDKTAGMDEALKKADHPFAGLGAAVKDKFKAALQDKNLAMASPIEILDAVKKDALNQKGEDGKTLLERGYDYKLNKDQGGLFSFHPSKFIPGMEPYSDKGTVALPGYAEYKDKHEQQSTSVPESVAMGAAGALVGAGLSALTGGAAPLGVIAGRMAMAGALAIPEFKAFDAASNLVKNSDYGQSEDTSSLGKLGAELALGVVAGAVMHKGVKFGLGAGLTKAIEAGKLSESAVATLKSTGLATDAIKAFEARTAQANELVKVQTNLDAANASIQREASLKAKKAELLAATGKDDAEMSLPEFLDKLHGENSAPFIPSDYAKVMGVDEGTLEAAKQNPVALFSLIQNPEIEDSILNDIREGKTAQQAVLKGFNQEAALRLGKSGILTDDEAYANARLNQPLGKESRVAKGSGKDVNPVKLDLTNGMDKLLNEPMSADESRLGMPIGGKAEKGVSVKSDTTVNDSLLNTQETEVTPVTNRLDQPLGGKAEDGTSVKSVNSVTDSLGNLLPPETPTNRLDQPLGGKPETGTSIKSDSQVKGKVDTVGSSLTNENGAIKKDVTGSLLANTMLKSVAAVGATSTALISLLSPDDAEASTASLAGKVASEPVVKSLVEEVGGDLKKVFSTLFERRLVSQPVTPGTTVLPQMQLQLYNAPAIGRSVEAYNQVVGKASVKGLDGLARFASTNFFSQVYGTTNRSISVQLASMQNAIANNINNGLDVAKYIIEGVKGIKPEHTKEIAAFMKPIQDEYDAIAIPLRAAELETAKANEVIKNVNNALKDGKYSPEDAAALTKEQRDRISKFQALWHEYQPQFDSVNAKYEAAKDQLIQKYPSARISFAVEDPSLMEKYSQFYTTDEKAAVAQFQRFYGDYKLRAQEVGMETITGPYINHSRDNSVIKEELQKRLEELGATVNKGIPLTDFFSRSKYSKQMIPDIVRNAYEYVPDTERRIQGADFWRVGRQDGWHAFSQNEMIRSNKVWSDYFDRIKQGMVPPPATTMNKLADRYAQVETLRLLAFLPSAPFKHVFKNIGTWASLGFTHSMLALPESVKIAFRNSVNNALRDLGYTDRMLPKGSLDDFINSMVKQRSLINPLSDLERPEGLVNGVDKWLNNLNGVGGIGIRAVEAADRAHTVYAALDMSLKKGMTVEQSMTGIYDMILKNNFLGGVLNPSWMHNPKIRALALFQNTPFKILERRLVNAYKTGQDVKTAWGVIKGQKVEETLNQLMDLKAFIHSGQNEFKKNMIYDALTTSKDAFGNSISAQFMKEFLITGAILGAGSATGVDFESHTFHIPFIKPRTHEPVLATSPIIDASWKTFTGKPSPGHENDEDKEFFPSRFLRHWLGSSGGAQPLLLHKFQRITSDDIPKIYRDSPMRYLFSVPGKE